MQGFWVKKEVTLQHAGKTHRLLPPDAQAIANKKIPMSAIYCGNVAWEIIQAKRILGADQVDDLGRLNVSNLPLPVAFSAEQTISSWASGSNATPKSEGVIRLALLNGMGTMLGDTLVGCQALELAIQKVAQLTGCKVEVDVSLAWNARPGAELLIARVKGVRHVIEHAITLQDLQAYDAYWDFSNLLTMSGYEDLHVLDFYLDSLGVASASIASEHKKPFVRTPASLVEEAQLLLYSLTQGAPIVHIQGEASNPLRSMPAAEFERLAKSILDNTQAYCLITQKVDASFFKSDRLLHLADWSQQSIDHYLALIQNVQTLVSVDTLAVHVALALDLPGIGFYTSIEPQLRVGYAQHFQGVLIPQAKSLPGWGKHKSDEQWHTWADAYAQSWRSIDFKGVVKQLFESVTPKVWQPATPQWLKDFVSVAPLHAKRMRLHGQAASMAMPLFKSFAAHVEVGTPVHANFAQGVLTLEAEHADGSLELGLVVRNPLYFNALKSTLKGMALEPSAALESIKRQLQDQNWNWVQQIALDKQALPADAPLAALSAWLRTDQPLLEAQLCTPYWLLRTTKQAPVKLNVGALALKKMAGVNEPRIDHPLTLLRGFPGVQTHWQSEGFVVRDGWAPGVLILLRQFLNTPQLQSGIEGLIAKGWSVVIEIDDDPHHWPAYVNSKFHAFKAAHGVSVSTKPLAQIVKAWNPEVQVFENQIFKLPNHDLQEKLPEEKLRVFFGALNRQKDWQSVLPGIQMAIDHFGDRLHFVVVHDQAFHDALKTPHKEFWPTLPQEDYLKQMHACHVALLPLLDTPFNRLKSDLKFIECCAMGVVPIASPTVYATEPAHKNLAWMANTPKQWFKALQEAVEDNAALHQRRLKAYAHVQSQRMLSQHIGKRFEWFQSLRTNFADLEQQRQKRLQAHAPSNP